jgi:hypothetical protein
MPIWSAVDRLMLAAKVQKDVNLGLSVDTDQLGARGY